MPSTSKCYRPGSGQITSSPLKYDVVVEGNGFSENIKMDFKCKLSVSKYTRKKRCITKRTQLSPLS